MSIMISKDKKELVVTCKCGCGDGFHTIKVEPDEHDDTYFIMSYISSNFYRNQNRCFSLLKNKLKKIWSIIRNKDYYCSDVIMKKEDFQQFKEYINQF